MLCQTIMKLCNYVDLVEHDNLTAISYLIILFIYSFFNLVLYIPHNLTKTFTLKSAVPIF